MLIHLPKTCGGSHTLGVFACHCVVYTLEAFTYPLFHWEHYECLIILCMLIRWTMSVHPITFTYIFFPFLVIHFVATMFLHLELIVELTYMCFFLNVEITNDNGHTCWVFDFNLYRFLFHWTKYPRAHNHLPLVHIPNPISFNWYLIILVNYFCAKEYHLGCHKCNLAMHINEKNSRLLINYQDITKWNIWAFKYLSMFNNS